VSTRCRVEPGRKDALKVKRSSTTPAQPRRPPYLGPDELPYDWATSDWTNRRQLMDEPELDRAASESSAGRFVPETLVPACRSSRRRSARPGPIRVPPSS
jgi:hypothetical protein